MHCHIGINQTWVRLQPPDVISKELHQELTKSTPDEGSSLSKLPTPQVVASNKKKPSTIKTLTWKPKTGAQSKKNQPLVWVPKDVTKEAQSSKAQSDKNNRYQHKTK